MNNGMRVPGRQQELAPTKDFLDCNRQVEVRKGGMACVAKVQKMETS